MKKSFSRIKSQLILLIGLPLLLFSCQTDLAVNETPVFSTLSDCAANDTKIHISLADLRIACEGGADCFARYEDKMGIISHLKEEPNQAKVDPAYLGYFLNDGSVAKFPGINCSEPPPGGGGIVAPTTPAIDLLSSTGKNVYLEFSSCADQAGNPSDGKFIGITFLDLNYEKTYEHYAGLSCKSGYLNNKSAKLPLTCSTDGSEIKWENELSAPKFTAKIAHGPSFMYVTIIKTPHTDKVIRIAYSNPAYLDGRFIFE